MGAVAGESDYELVGGDLLCGAVWGSREGESSNKKQPESPMNIFAFCGEAQKSTERNPGKHCPQPPPSQETDAWTCYGTVKGTVTPEIWRMKAFGLLVRTFRLCICPSSFQEMHSHSHLTICGQL